MALTESRLRQIVREEARKVMREAPHGRFGGMYDDKKLVISSLMTIWTAPSAITSIVNSTTTAMTSTTR